MPQVTFEYSDSINCSEDRIHLLYSSIIKTLEEEFGVIADGIKFRSHKLLSSQIGHGDNFNGFVHLAIAVLKKADRSQDKFDRLGETYLEFLADNFSVDKKCISVEFREMDAKKYYKY